MRLRPSKMSPYTAQEVAAAIRHSIDTLNRRGAVPAVGVSGRVAFDPLGQLREIACEVFGGADVTTAQMLHELDKYAEGAGY